MTLGFMAQTAPQLVVVAKAHDPPRELERIIGTHQNAGGQVRDLLGNPTDRRGHDR